MLCYIVAQCHRLLQEKTRKQCLCKSVEKGTLVVLVLAEHDSKILQAFRGIRFTKGGGYHGCFSCLDSQHSFLNRVGDDIMLDKDGTLLTKTVNTVNSLSAGSQLWSWKVL
jgi:hypothetical protein